MQNPIKYLHKALFFFFFFFFEKPGTLSENVKTLTSSHNPRECFLLKLRTRFPLTNVTEMVFEIFLFYLDLELSLKTSKVWFLQTRFLHFY